MPNTLDELVEIQRKEREKFVKDCPHLDILTYCIDGTQSYLAYVQDCVNGHPDSRKKRKDRRTT